ncbi:MAG: RraA family protein [Cyclobacteriaceae bacterium]|nr:RraA family protein [Cyclobacteriaceae bacterium]
MKEIKLTIHLATIICFLSSQAVFAQTAYTPQGVRMLENKTFDNSDEARKEILDLYHNLRVTDVLDGMDLIGLQDIGLMHNDIRPLWRDVKQNIHRIVGFAVTVRYVPTDMRVGEGSFESTDMAKQWKSEQYGRASDRGWVSSGKKGDVVVMDVNGVFECGNIGSNNSLGWAEAGFSGVITNGGARDTDEIIRTQQIPVYCRDGYSTRGIRPGRLIIDSYNYPINCGGVLVYPGDLIVADGDGVIVVPREHAVEVAILAIEVMEGDQKSRLNRYKRLGIPLDDSVKPFDN